MVLMDIWQTLEIEATPDTKAIKRAYAKKLKITRPDEDPQGFQSLHNAYKAALHRATYWEYDEDEDEVDDLHEENNNQTQAENVITSSEQSTDILTPSVTEEIIDSKINEPSTEFSTKLSTESSITASLELSTESSSEFPIQNFGETSTENLSETLELNSPEISNNETPTPEIPVNPLQVEGERLLGLAELFLAASDGSQNNPKNWQFIIESPYILEDHFNWRLGLELLQTIHQHNLNQVAKPLRIVGQDALSYLNNIFNWSENRQHILRALGDECATWLDMIKDPMTESQQDWQSKIRGGKLVISADKKPNSELKIADVGGRFGAWFIDFIILMVVLALLSDGKSVDGKSIADSGFYPIICVLVAFGYFLFFEISALQGTIGKRIFKLKVVDFTDETLLIKQAALRTFLYLAFYLIPFVILHLKYVHITHELLGAGINLSVMGWFLYISIQPVNLYDRISKTRVVQN
jgi:uncharacterized RDD family membrane protein YckC